MSESVDSSVNGSNDQHRRPALARTASTPRPFTANRDGFFLNAAVACRPHQCDRLERLCRYIT